MVFERNAAIVATQLAVELQKQAAQSKNWGLECRT
jgi:hypothetical protein